MAIANTEDDRIQFTIKSFLTATTSVLCGSLDSPVVGDLKEDLGLDKKTYSSEIMRCLRCNRTYTRVGIENATSMGSRKEEFF